MNASATISMQRIQQVREQVQAAIASGAADGNHTVEVLQASLEILNALVAISPPRPRPGTLSGGSILHTFEDEDCPPAGREIDVRIHYTWNDYDPADEPFPIWGAHIEDLEVLAVRYFDPHGKVLELGAYHQELAWSLLAKETEAVTQACTDHGCRTGVGMSHPLYTPSRVDLSPGSARRMAPSARNREVQRARRKSM